jgi:hypothetical protein
LIVLFFLFAALSYFSTIASVFACATLLLFVAALAPRLGIPLLVICAPVQGIFAIPRTQMQIVLAVGMLGLAGRHGHLVLELLRNKIPKILFIFSMFALVFAARALFEVDLLTSNELLGIAKEGLFYISLLITALATYSYADDRAFLISLLQSITFATGLIILTDVIGTYYPDWGDALGLAPVWSDMRFAGLHVNPNATAKFLAIGMFLACCTFWAARAVYARAVSFACVILVTFAVSATFSKSILIGVFGALLVLIVHPLRQRDWRRLATVLALLLIVSSASATWDLFLAPLARSASINRQFGIQKITNLNSGTSADEETFGNRLQRELRTSHSFVMRLEEPSAGIPPNSEMYRNVPGHIVYTARDCDWTCAGQRDRIWGAGVAIVADHWLLGIGPGHWRREFQSRLGFPFDSPHNAILEAWGGYGLAGLSLYLLLVIQLVCLAGESLRLSRWAFEDIFPAATSLYVLAILLTELVDPAKFLAMSSHSVWLWIFVAALARTLETRVQSPEASSIQSAPERPLIEAKHLIG